MKRGIVSEYEFDIGKASDLTVIQFDAPTKEWLDFVCKNRCGKQVEHFDIAIGPVADDSVFATITFFENGVYTEQQTIEKLKAERLQNQILFHTEKALSLLTFVDSEEVLL